MAQRRGAQGPAAGDDDQTEQQPGSAVAARFTRREVLVTAATTAAALTVAGCAQAVSHAPATSKSTPKPFALGRSATLYVDGTVPAALTQAVMQRLAGVAGIPGATAAPSLATAPDLVLSFGRLPAGYTGVSVGASPVTLITHLRVPLDTVTSAQAHALLGGASADWNAVGAPASLPVHVVALAELPVPTGVQLVGGAQSLATVDAVVNAVRGAPGSLALVPLEAADWSVRNLGVDGVYPAQGRGGSASAPFAAYTLQLGVSKALVARGLRPQQVATALAPALATAAPVLDIAVAGDVMLGRGVNNKMVAYGDYSYPYRQIHDELQSADLRFANLECTITDLVPVPTDPATFDFVSAKRAVDGLVYAGFSAVTVANNHAGGAGTETLQDMLSTLRGHSIATCGGGSNLSEARKPAIVSAKGARVALLGYDAISPQCPYATESSPGLAPLDLDTLPQDIAEARTRADLVIPYFHWGIEYTKDPTVEQQQAAHAAIDAGADMVLGVHPHWVQGIESYKGRLIIYALGNFIFDQDWSRPTMEGMLLHMYWRGATLASVRFVPVVDVDRCQPRVMSPAEATGVFERMWSGTDMLAAGQHGPEYEP